MNAELRHDAVGFVKEQVGSKAFQEIVLKFCFHNEENCKLYARKYSQMYLKSQTSQTYLLQMIPSI